MFHTGPTGYNDLADYIATLYKQSKQDGVIFFGTKPNEAWLKYLVEKEPLIFRTNNPMFMPLDYLGMVELKLDTNIIFYEKEKDGRYNLFDRFAVRGEPPIYIELGSWDDQNGINLNGSISRWDRRTDLRGATFRNFMSNWADNGWLTNMTRDHSGKVIGFEGFNQDILIAIVERLNLTMSFITNNEPWQWFDNGSFTSDYGLLQRGDIDVDSSGNIWVRDLSYFALMRGVFNFLPMDVYRDTITLYGPIATGRTLDTWAYIEVFGALQWGTFFAILVTLTTALTIAEACFKPDENDSHLLHFLSNIAMSLLFFLQGGSHSTVKGQTTQLLSLMISALTLFIFISYTQDITAKMTSLPPNREIRSFDDVLEQGFKVTVGNFTFYEGHFNPETNPTWVKNGSAKHKIYMKYLSNKTKLLDINNFQDDKLLLYTDSSIFRGRENQIKAYDIEEQVTVPTAFVTPRNSEFSEIFAHYILKQQESGILQLNGNSRNYPARREMRIGITEPQPLGYTNVMLIFAILGGGMCVAAFIACVEHITKKVMTRKEQKKMLLIQIQPAVNQRDSHGISRGSKEDN